MRNSFVGLSTTKVIHFLFHIRKELVTNCLMQRIPHSDQFVTNQQKLQERVLLNLITSYSQEAIFKKVHLGRAVVNDNHLVHSRIVDT